MPQTTDMSAFTDTKNFPEINPKVHLDFTHHGVHYIINGSLGQIGSIGYVPARRTEDPLESYFHTPVRLRRTIVTHAPSQHGYDQKARHENRQNSMIRLLRIWEEEESRKVPIASSSEIGRFWKEDSKIDTFKFSHPHIPCIEQEFFSRTGVMPEMLSTELQTLPGSRPVNTRGDDKKFYK